MNKATILLVDDDQDLLIAVKLLLKPVVKQILIEQNPEQIPALLRHHQVDAILLDMNFKSTLNTGNEGLYWLERIQQINPTIPVVMITAYAAVDLAVTALKRGAKDFIVKPWQNEQLLDCMKQLFSGKKKKNSASMQPQLDFIGKSAIMEDLLFKLSKIAPTDANILILGENGTGKDLIASEIHARSLRKNMPFVKVDVGALTDTLFESELFGHKKGAFTDAREDRIGRIEAAHGGSLFLDEIGNISLQQQAKLLSVLQNRQLQALGSNQLIPVDIRLLSATNVPLAVLADEQRFRRDLIYRLNTVEIQVPPLRARGEDIYLLASHFIQLYATKYSKSIGGLSKDAKAKLQAYHFPGNVRELQYSMERAVIMADHEELNASDILFSPLENKMESVVLPEDGQHNLEELERKTIKSVVDRHQGNISKAARELGLTRAALYRRLDKYSL